jgi:ferredoxin
MVNMRTTRRLTQLSFLLLTLAGVYVFRGHAERWCPFGGVEALYTYVQAGNLTCSLGISNFYILGGVLILTLIARRAFCSYVCPLGTIGEWLHALGRKLRVPQVRVPYRLDRALALLKYAVLALILYFTWNIGELAFRGYDPCYVLISRHGEDITVWAYVITAGLALGSLLLMVPLCRWLCPLAAVFTPFSRFGLLRVTRHASACTNCGVCGRQCPMGIRVDTVGVVAAARCTSCLECVSACPQRSGGALTWGPPRGLGRSWPGAVIVPLVLLCLGGAVAATYAFPLPSFVATHGAAPTKTESITLRVSGVKCRHSTEQFVEFLTTRDDEFALRGYLRVEAWPEPGWGAVRLVFDPTRDTAVRLRSAITEARFDAAGGTWSHSPYRIQGYDALSSE